jgi:hypothetical protein
MTEAAHSCNTLNGMQRRAQNAGRLARKSSQKISISLKNNKKQSKNPYHKVNIIQKFIKQIHIIKLKSSKFDCEHWPKKGP